MKIGKKTHYKALAIASCLSFLFTLIGTGAYAGNNYGLDESAGQVSAFKSQITSYNANFLSSKVGSIIGLVLSFVGVIFLILMIYAGITWMTAAGNEKKTEEAKQLITNAIIGLIIVTAAYAITSFVGNYFL